MARSAQAIRQLAHHPSTPMNRWSKSGVLDRVFAQLQHAHIICVKIKAVALDSTLVKIYPGWHGGVRKTARKPLAGPATDARTALTFALSSGQAHDASEGRKLLQRFGGRPCPIPLLMDRAYEGDATRQLAVNLGYVPVGPPKQNRLAP